MSIKKTEQDLSGIALRFRQVRKHLNLTTLELGKKANLSHSGILEIEGGKRRPSVHLCALLASEYGIDIHWLLTGEGEMFVKSRYIDVPAEIEVKPAGEIEVGKIKFLTLPLHSIYAGAGFAGIIDNPKVEDIILVPKKLLPHVKPKDVFCVRVAGESMEPTLLDSDIIAIDSSWHHEDVSPLDGQLVALVDSHGDLQVKRLKIEWYKKGKKQRVATLYGMCDNPRHLPVVLYPPFEQGRNPVVGKVVLILRTKIL